MGEIFCRANSPKMAWMGRTVEFKEGAVRLGYPGVWLGMNVRSERVSLKIHTTSPDCWFGLRLDQGPWVTLPVPKGQSDLLLASGLDASQPHRILLAHRNESWQGIAEIQEVLLPDQGKFLAPPVLPDRRLLFVGDSVTCGGSNEINRPDFPYAPENSNALSSFGLETARRLNAQAHLVSYGGRGLTRDWEGHGNDEINNAPVFFERALPDDPKALWDHAAYQPDAVVVTLGVNDFNQGLPDRTFWKEAWESFVSRLREVHPNAWIVLMNHPMLNPEGNNQDPAKLQFLTEILDEIATGRRTQDDRKISRGTFRYQPGGPHDSHPTAAQHLIMADDLVPILKAILGWDETTEGTLL